MQGACGIILDTDDPNVVIKKIYRKSKGNHRIKSHRAREQYRLQQWAHNVLKNSWTLFVPQAWNPEDHQYMMERIDVSDPISHDLMGVDKDLYKELAAFYAEGKKTGIYPMDFELYRQADGRIAMVDFDKFGVWNEDKSVTFPWGLYWSAKETQDYTPINLNLDFF